MLIKTGLGDAEIRHAIELAPRPLWLFQLLERPYLTALFALNAVAFGLRLWLHRRSPKSGLWRHSQVHSLIFLVCTVAQLQASFQPMDRAICVLWYSRYQSYLIVLGLVALTLQLRDLPAEFGRLSWGWLAQRSSALALLALLLVAAEGTWFAQYTAGVIPQASHNIFSQQYQMAEFVRRYYSGEVVALNDIGAVNDKADIRCFDFIGLGSTDVARIKMRGEFDRSVAARLVREHNAKIAIVYSGWLRRTRVLPDGWYLVGQWGISNNVICGESLVDFYAVDRVEAEKLGDRMTAFAPNLPRDAWTTRVTPIAAHRP